MERVIISLDEKIDYYLHKICNSPSLTLHPRELYEVPVIDAETYLLDQVMLEKGLLKIDKESRVLSSKGLEISNFGGWLSYKKQLQRENLRKEPKTENEKKLSAVVEQLTKENDQLKIAVEQSREKETTTMLIIKNLLQQNRNNAVLLVLAGVSIGFILANAKWIVSLLLQ